MELDLSTLEPTVAGSKRPQDKILLKDFKGKFIDLLDKSFGRTYLTQEARKIQKSITRFEGEGGDSLVSKSNSKTVSTEIEAKFSTAMKYEERWNSQRQVVRMGSRF